MTVTTLHDKFVYHLQEMYYVENRLLEVLDDLADDVANEALRDGLHEHQQQTQDHARRLEEVFQAVGESPQERESPTMDALVEEREKFFSRAAGDEDMHDLHDLGAAAKSEHLEIAGYENLIMIARKLDLSTDVRDLLEANLDEERETKKQLKSLAEDSTARKIFARLAG